MSNIEISIDEKRIIGKMILSRLEYISPIISPPGTTISLRYSLNFTNETNETIAYNFDDIKKSFSSWDLTETIDVPFKKLNKFQKLILFLFIDGKKE